MDCLAVLLYLCCRETFHLPDDLTEEEKLEPVKNATADPRIRLLNRLYAKKRKVSLPIAQCNFPFCNMRAAVGYVPALCRLSEAASQVFAATVPRAEFCFLFLHQPCYLEQVVHYEMFRPTGPCRSLLIRRQQSWLRRPGHASRLSPLAMIGPWKTCSHSLVQSQQGEFIHAISMAVCIH